MHQALEIPEILLNIFGHCDSYYAWREPSSLVSLARTCRAFKEPALDVLWGELVDPSSLARCLPDASHHQETSSKIKCYSFSRPLTRTEWGILRSYAHRILSLGDYQYGLAWESARIFLGSPPTEPLFPNLRHLYVGPSAEIKYLWSMLFPSLNSFSITFVNVKDSNILQYPLRSFCELSPNNSRLSVRWNNEDTIFSNFFFSSVCQWKNLQTVDCYSVPLDVNALEHLSHMPALTCLSFKLGTTLLGQISSSNSPLSFPNLNDLALQSYSLGLISKLLPRIRLPAITCCSSQISACPSQQDLFTFLYTIQKSSIGDAIQGLFLTQLSPPCVISRLVLGIEELQPCTAFNNLGRLNINIEWKVDFTDNELLNLAPAWPHLKQLLINTWWGWQTRYFGITPNGLVRLLQTCPSLGDAAIAMNTSGYDEFVPSSIYLGFTLPPEFSINVLDSIIEPASVPAIASFFASIAPHANFSLLAWKTFTIATVYKSRWDEILVKEAIRQRS